MYMLERLINCTAPSLASSPGVENKHALRCSAVIEARHCLLYSGVATMVHQVWVRRNVFDNCWYPLALCVKWRKLTASKSE